MYSFWHFLVGSQKTASWFAQKKWNALGWWLSNLDQLTQQLGSPNIPEKKAVFGGGDSRKHKPYPYSLYRWGFLHLRYLKCLVIGGVPSLKTERKHLWKTTIFRCKVFALGRSSESDFLSRFKGIFQGPPIFRPASHPYYPPIPLL